MSRADSENNMPSMTRSDLVRILSEKQDHLAPKDVELAIRSLIDIMSGSLSSGERIEIRGFGSFNLHYHPPRVGRNPRTGEPVNIRGKYVPHFRPGKDLRRKLQ